MLPKDIYIRLHYLMEQHDGEKDISELTKRKPACETHTLSVLETIQDIRGAHEELDLDLQGFRYVKAPTKFDDWASENEIRKFLIPEIEDLLRQEMEGCDEIHVIDIKVGLALDPHQSPSLTSMSSNSTRTVAENWSTSTTPHQAWCHWCTRCTRLRLSTSSAEGFD
jgi:hypothetical protein